MQKVLDELLEKVKSYNPNADFALITKAFNVAEEKHSGQFRESGEPFVTHPIQVAMILADMELD